MVSATTLDRPSAAGAWRHDLPALRAAGLGLREPRVSEAAHLASVFGPEVATVLGVEAPATADEWAHFVAHVRADRHAGHTACFVVEHDGESGLSGIVLLQRLVPQSRVATASLFLPPSWYASGIAPRAVGLALDFAVSVAGVARIEGRAATQDELDMMLGLGAVEEGILRAARPVPGGFADLALWSVLSSDRAGTADAQGRTPASTATDADRETPAPETSRPSPWTTTLPVLKGPMVTLREVDLLDAPVLLNALSPDDVAISFEPAPKTRDDMRRYIAWVQLQRSLGRAAGFAIVPRGSRHAAGLLQVRRADTAGAIAEWGIVIADRYRGTGVAADAVRLMAAFSFETLGVHRLEARSSGIDPRSVGLMRKVGAVREARLRQSFVHDGEIRDDDLWAILKSDWR